MLGLVAVFLLVAVCFLSTSTADNNRHDDKRACVILGWSGYSLVKATNIYDFGVAGGPLTTNIYTRQVGMKVEFVSRSHNAPEVNVGSDLAETIAYLLENKLVQRDMPGNQLMFTK